nr:putative F-box protein At1g19160 [Ipomoea batatas]
MSVDNYSWDISVWNSATREIKKLQNLEALDGFDPNCIAIGFGGYGFSSNMIGKVVMIWVTPDPIVMVYSQDRNNSCGWKRSGHSLGNFYVNNTGSNLYLKGKYYWICIVQGQNYKEQSHLLWFDFDDETFGKIELPKLDPLAAISAMKDTIALIKQSKIMDLNATLKSFDPRSCIDSLESPSDEVNEDEDKKKQANNEKGNEHLKLGKHIFAGFVLPLLSSLQGSELVQLSNVVCQGRNNTMKNNLPKIFEEVDSLESLSEVNEDETRIEGTGK